MACFSPQNFQLWLIATCFPCTRDKFDEDRICRAGICALPANLTGIPPHRRFKGFTRAGIHIWISMTVGQLIRCMMIYIDYRLFEVYVERYWKPSAAAWTFVIADTTKVKHVANRHERIKPCKTHIFPWSKNPFCNPHDMCEWLWKKMLKSLVLDLNVWTNWNKLMAGYGN